MDGTNFRFHNSLVSRKRCVNALCSSTKLESSVINMHTRFGDEKNAPLHARPRLQSRGRNQKQRTLTGTLTHHGPLVYSSILMVDVIPDDERVEEPASWSKLELLPFRQISSSPWSSSEMHTEDTKSPDLLSRRGDDIAAAFGNV